jgi:hypothetical protein
MPIGIQNSRSQMHHFFGVLENSLFFGLAGIVFGFAVDYIFPDPTPTEGYYVLLGLALLQIIVTTLVVYYIDMWYERYMGVDSDTFFGMTMFIVVFFLVQNQLFRRLDLLRRWFSPTGNCAKPGEFEPFF